MLGIQECCRICLGQALPIYSVHLSYRITVSKTVFQAINECSSIQISEHDSFPKYVCIKCYQQLLVVNDFRELILRSDGHLKQKLANVTQLYDNSAELVSTLKDRAQTITTVLDVKCEDHKTLEPGNVCVKSEESVSDIEFCKDNSNKCQTEINKRISNGLINESQTHNIKQEVPGKLRPGRKPSTVSKSKRKVQEFKCDICHKVLFGRSNRLKLHIITAHSEIKNFECDTCSKRFKTKKQLINHTRVHTGEKPYHCDICQKKFRSTQNLFNHKRTHTGQHKSYKCLLCEKGYLTPGELETHKRIVHTGEKPFLCEICSRSYSSVRNLRLHIRSVHEKNEKCPKCGLMLSHRTIKQHIQKHQDKEAGIRRYTCDKCGKGFFNVQAVKKHQLIHTGEKPYSCEVCRKGFTQKSAVVTHMRTHSDVRSFCCGLCAKTFKYKQHLRTHTKKKHNVDTKLDMEINDI